MSDAIAHSKMASFDSLESGRIFFTNLLLLGFDHTAMERKYRIPFNKDMFSLPNKKGFEAVALFLFTRLDETRCQEEFRDCWQVRDKKEEQTFRKVCNNWLSQIAKDDPNSYLPRIVSSLFMSPGGDKFTQFMLCFSRYVLHQTMMREHRAKCVKDFLHHPVLTSQNAVMAPVIFDSIAAGSIRQRQKFLRTVQDSVFVKEEWNSYVHDQTKAYRQKVKTTRDLEREVNDEKQKLAERSPANVGPAQTKSKPGASAYDFEIQAVKRAQVVQQVRNMWKMFDDFRSVQSADCEIIDSILQGTLEKFRIDASELNIKIPDLLLSRCEQELQRRNVDNIYEGGNVNLQSLIHLWNLSLHLYAEKLHEAGVPKLDAAVPGITTMVETHRAYCVNSENLRRRLETDLLPDMKQSIDHYKQELDKELLSSVSPGSIRITAFGLGLMPPTPPFSFEPQEARGGTERGRLPAENILRLKKPKVTTPDAACQLMKDINEKVYSQHLGLAQGLPVYAPTNKIHGTDKSKALSLGVDRKVGDFHSSGVSQMVKPKPVVVKHSLKQERDRFPASNVKSKPSQKLQTASQHPLQSINSKSAAGPDNRTSTNSKVTSSKNTKQILSNSKPAAAERRPSGNTQPSIGKVDRHYGVIASATQHQNDPLEILASKIASTVRLESPEDKENSAKNSFENFFGGDVFQSREKLEHTPPSGKHGSWQDTRLSDSIGPLSSTHIESPMRISVNRREIDTVALKLFSPKLAGSNNHTTDVLSDRFPPSSGYKNVVEMDSPRSARTPSTICSASPVNSETEDHSDDEATSENEIVELRNDESQNRLQERKMIPMDEAENKLHVRQDLEEEENSEVEEAVSEQISKEKSSADAEMRFSQHRRAVNEDKMGDSFRNFDFKSLDFEENGHVAESDHRLDVVDGDDLLGDNSLLHLGETLQFLRETKTPHLPSRVVRLTGKQTVPVQGITISRDTFDRDVRHDSITPSEQLFHSWGKGLLNDGNSSLPVDLNQFGIENTRLPKNSSLHERDFTSNLKCRTISMPAKDPTTVKFETDEFSKQSKDVQNKFNGLEKVSDFGSDLGAGDCLSNTSLQSKEGKLHSRASAQRESCTDSAGSSVDSLILRFQKLRSQKDDEEQVKEPTDLQRDSSVGLASSLLESYSSCRDDRESKRPFLTVDFNKPSIVATNSEPCKGAGSGFEVRSPVRREMLQDEDFSDVRRLLELSLADSPDPRSGHRLSLQRGDCLMPSPLTDAVHSTDVSFARLNDSAMNLLDCDASILVPSSPANRCTMSVVTGELVDLS